MNNNQRILYKDIYGKMASQKSKEGKQRALAEGKHTSTAPLGYRWIRHGSQRRGYSEMIIDEDAAMIVHDLFSKFATGAYNYQAICDYGRDTWGITRNKFAMQRMLESKFYRGILETKSYGSNAHNYPRIIDDALFDRVQEVIQSKKVSFSRPHINNKNKDVIYRGLLKCAECDCQITAEKHKGHIYYHCTQSKYKHKAPWLNQKIITETLRNILDDIQNNQDLRIIADASVLQWPNPDQSMLRELLCMIFKKIVVKQNKDIEYKLWSAGEILQRQNKEIKPLDTSSFDVNGNIHENIKLLCLVPQTIDMLCKTLEKDLDTIQSALVDLQLEGKLDQNLEGLWITL